MSLYEILIQIRFKDVLMFSWNTYACTKLQKEFEKERGLAKHKVTKIVNICKICLMSDIFLHIHINKT